MQLLNELIIIVSISLTIPFLCMCIEIYNLWSPSLAKDPIPSRVLSKGIIFGFTANFLDNVYWGIVWFLFLMKNEHAVTFAIWGSIANVFLRQGGGIIAAFHHVHAANMVHQSRALKHHKWYWSLGLVTFITLILIKYY